MGDLRWFTSPKDDVEAIRARNTKLLGLFVKGAQSLGEQADQYNEVIEARAAQGDPASMLLKAPSDVGRTASGGLKGLSEWAGGSGTIPGTALSGLATGAEFMLPQTPAQTVGGLAAGKAISAVAPYAKSSLGHILGKEFGAFGGNMSKLLSVDDETLAGLYRKAGTEKGAPDANRMVAEYLKSKNYEGIHPQGGAPMSFDEFTRSGERGSAVNPFDELYKKYKEAQAKFESSVVHGQSGRVVNENKALKGAVTKQFKKLRALADAEGLTEQQLISKMNALDAPQSVPLETPPIASPVSNEPIFKFAKPAKEGPKPLSKLNERLQARRDYLAERDRLLAEGELPPPAPREYPEVEAPARIESNVLDTTPETPFESEASRRLKNMESAPIPKGGKKPQPESVVRGPEKVKALEEELAQLKAKKLEQEAKLGGPANLTREERTAFRKERQDRLASPDEETQKWVDERNAKTNKKAADELAKKQALIKEKDARIKQLKESTGKAKVVKPEKEMFSDAHKRELERAIKRRNVEPDGRVYVDGEQVSPLSEAAALAERETAERLADEKIKLAKIKALPNNYTKQDLYNIEPSLVEDTQYTKETGAHFLEARIADKEQYLLDRDLNRRMYKASAETPVPVKAPKTLKDIKPKKIGKVAKEADVVEVAEAPKEINIDRDGNIRFGNAFVEPNKDTLRNITEEASAMREYIEESRNTAIINDDEAAQVALDAQEANLDEYVSDAIKAFRDWDARQK